MWTCRVSVYEENSREVDVVSREGAGETASSTRDEGKALSTENEAVTLGIFDNPWQDCSEDAVQFWHDESGPDRFVSAVKDKNAPQTCASTSNEIVLVSHER